MRLATPTVTVNGVAGHPLSSTGAASQGGKHAASPAFSDRHDDDRPDTYVEDHSLHDAPAPEFGLEELIRSLAAKLSMVAVQGASQPLSIDRAKQLAHAAIEQILQSTPNRQTLSRAGLLAGCATWLGLAPDFGLDHGNQAAMEGLEIRPSPVPGADAPPRDELTLPQEQRQEQKPANGSEGYSLSWTLRWGAMTGKFGLDVRVPHEHAPESMEGQEQEQERGREDLLDRVLNGTAVNEKVAWRTEYLALRAQRDAQLARIKRHVLDAIM